MLFLYYKKEEGRYEIKLSNIVRLYPIEARIL